MISVNKGESYVRCLSSGHAVSCKKTIRMGLRKCLCDTSHDVEEGFCGLLGAKESWVKETCICHLRLCDLRNDM